MVRRRLKHKEVLETIHQDDLQVAKQKLRDLWDSVRPYEGIITTTLIVVVLGTAGLMYLKNTRTSRRADANSYLSDARSNFVSGDTIGALQELDQVKAGGDYSDKKVRIAAGMIHAGIAYASGEYENAISILTELIPDAPETIQADLMYQLADAQESNGDLEAADKILEDITSHFDKEPETNNPDRETSVWDRYYYRKGRLLVKMGKEKEAIGYLLKVSERSRWIMEARTELAWIKGKPVGAIPVKWEPRPES
jgi:tetratricopeptide (TPR) repeat protein